MSAHRVIITAAGDAKRWNNWRGVPKHLVDVNGEPLLARTVRQLREADPSVDIWITGPNDERYEQRGARLYVPSWRPDFRECSMYVWAAPLWNEDGRTTFMYGDTFYSDDAVASILAGPGHLNAWHLWARFKASEITGKPWPEVWAHTFFAGEHRVEEQMIHAAQLSPQRGSIYEMYKWLHGVPLVPFSWEQTDLGGMTTIDDWTEDFDFNHDYEKFVARRKWPKL